MLTHMAAFEARYQLRTPLFAATFALFFLLTFGSVTLDQIQIGASANVHVNSPFAMLQTVGLMNVFAIFIVTAFVANVVIRDDETGFAPLIRATRISKADYLIGRFSGAFAVAFAVTASVPLAILVGSHMPWLDSEKLGPTVISHYLYALFVFTLPTMLVMAAGFFALATLTRSMMWTYVGVVGFLVLFIISRALLRDPAFDQVSALSDPFGLGAFQDATRYWTAAERNTQLPALTGDLLLNRMLWLGVAFALFAWAYASFRFDGQGRRKAKAKAHAAQQPAKADAAAHVVRALPAPRADAATRRAQLWALTRFDMAFVFKSPAFFVLLALGVLNSIGGLQTIVTDRSTDFFPVTRAVVDALTGTFTLIPLIVAIYYAGELVWRDRQQRIHDIVDATAAPAWAHLLPKVLAVAGVLAATYGVGMLTGLLFQAFHGVWQFDLSAYLLWFVLPGVIGGLLLAVLSVFVQVLVPSKPMGWGVMLVYLVSSLALNTAGFQHNLYQYAGTPDVPLSDMNGLGHFWQGRAWFQAYWLSFAAVLGLLSYGLWRRGAQDALGPRLRGLKQRLAGTPGRLLAASLALFTGLGGWIFYNTNMLNEYQPSTAREAALADKERALLGYESVPQPTITDVTLKVDLYPNEARAVTQGRYTLENRSGKPLDAVHLSWAKGLQLTQVDLPGATVAKEFSDYQYRIYRLARPLQPGETLSLGFSSVLEQPGFVNGRPQTQIVPNGTFLNNMVISPSLGFSRDGLLSDRSKRRKHGLPAELRMAKLEDDTARQRHMLRADSDFVQADITVSTDEDQTPIAPGLVLSDVRKDGRRTIQTRTEAPIHHFFSIQSGRYVEAQARWTPAQGKPVSLSVWHHPEHAYNVPRMLKAMEASLSLYQERFGPYQFQQARIVEFPAYERFAQAYAGTMPYSEAIGFIQNHTDDAEKVDMVTYVTAHEMAHQWWAHQLVGANQQGTALLSESFSQYSAMLVMEKLYGPAMLRKFLKVELDNYLRARGTEPLEELPLVRVENQPYIYYNKGSLVMWWAKEALGEAVVNRTLQKMLALYAFKPAPYPSAQAFVDLLKAEAGPDKAQVIADLFERITLYDLQATNAQATRRADGRYEVSFTVKARKLYADGQGKETEAPLDEAFEIGIFDAEPGKSGFSPRSVMAFERRKLASGDTKISFVTDKRPTHVGVDPYNKRIDRNSDDNVVKVTGP